MTAEAEHRPLHDVRAVNLPRGRHFALTFGLSDQFGGMTSALLHRSRAFVRLGATHVDVLTFDARVDYPQLTERLRARSDVIAGMRVLNLWDWLRENTFTRLAPTGLARNTVFSPLAPDEPAVDAVRHGDAGERKILVRTRLGADGTTALQIDYFRSDCTLLASDRRDCDSRGRTGGRSIVVCDREGKPGWIFSGIWGLYRAWLDELTADRQCFMIVDSKTVATFMLGYRRPNVVTAHIVHSSHLASVAQVKASPDGFAVRATRQAVFDDLGGFDSIVLLTQRQRDDVRRQLTSRRQSQPRLSRAVNNWLGAHEKQNVALHNIAVIPNSRTIGPRPAAEESRPIGRGIVLASLTPRKRVDHAIRAVVAAAQQAQSAGLMPPITLDIYGSGEAQTMVALQTLVAELDAAHLVSFHGYVPEARRHLSSASFLVTSGSSEGFPLVLVESMAAGCIPISYDVPYGPADIIDDGRTGFLVAAGDESQLAAAVFQFVSLHPDRVQRMRAAGRLTSERFSDEEVTGLWAQELAAAARRKNGPRSVPARVRDVLSLGKKAIRRVGRLALRRG